MGGRLRLYFLNGDAMKALIEYIAKSLVDHPEQVEVRETQTGNRVHLELSVAKDDMGRVIGKNGRVANSIRALLRVAAEREGKQATLDVMEP
jgi:uncharacterized protein